MLVGLVLDAFKFQSVGLHPTDGFEKAYNTLPKVGWRGLSVEFLG